MTTSALVLFSGGQDSATCLAWALSRYDTVETIGFDYGQRHKVELECRQHFLAKLKVAYPEWAAKLGQDHMLDMSLLGGVSDTALTAEKQIEFESSGLPNTFVPGRNLMFSPLQQLWPTGVGTRCWWVVCARPTTQDTQTVVMTH